ncbi:MAG: hypothetical protein WCF38_00960 [Pseudolabrys sp.]
MGSAAREIESAIDSDPGNALLWHASADTNARHFSTAANRGGPKGNGDRRVLVLDRDNWVLYEIFAWMIG